MVGDSLGNVESEKIMIEVVYVTCVVKGSIVGLVVIVIVWIRFFFVDHGNAGRSRIPLKKLFRRGFQLTPLRIKGRGDSTSLGSGG